MSSHASPSQDAAVLPRAFARMHATEVTASVQADNKSGLFLTIYTDPDRPEPEVGVIGG